MPFPTIDSLLAAFDETAQTYAPAKFGASNQANVGLWISSWRMTGSYQGAIPPVSPGQICNGATSGGIPIVGADAGKKLHLGRFLWSPNQAIGAYLMDRLVHTSGLVGNLATPQVVNTPALPPRAGDGTGVELWLEWYVSTGATVANVTVEYTNSEGVAGRVSQSVATLATMRGPAGALRIPLQLGDVGVQTVQNVTLSASTGTAGNFGVVLAKRVVGIPNAVANAVAGSGPISLGVPPIDNNACLFFIVTAASTASPTFDTELTFIMGDE